MEENTFKGSQENLSNIEKKLDAATGGDKKKKPAAAAKKGEKPGNAAPGKVKAKTKGGKGKKTASLDSDANNGSHLNSDAVTDLTEEKDENGLDKKNSDKNRDIEQFEEEDVDWESDLDVDGK
jgi:hypothetical protein